MNRAALILLIFMLCCIKSGADELKYKVSTNESGGGTMKSEMIVEIKRGVIDLGEEKGIVTRDKVKVNSGGLKALDEKYGLVSVEKLFSGTRKDIPSDIYVFRFSPGTRISDVIESYKKDESVIYAEQNYSVSAK